MLFTIYLFTYGIVNTIFDFDATEPEIVSKLAT